MPVLLSLRLVPISQPSTALLGEMVSRFQIPAFLAQCPFDLRISQYCRQNSLASEAWLHDQTCNPNGDNDNGNDNDKRLCTLLRSSKAGLLASMCYPTADFGQLRVCCDFINLLFYIKSLVDDSDRDHAPQCVAELAEVVLNALYYHPLECPPSDDKLAATVRHLWTRLQKTCPSVSLQVRLIESVENFFLGLQQNAIDRAVGAVPDVEDYIARRRETSICQPAFLLIEYAHGLNLPTEVHDDPIITNLTTLANDLISWSNDVFSYNVDQAHHSSHNIVALVMRENDVSLQDAVNYVGSLHRSTLHLFIDHINDIPRSWGAKIDSDVATYVCGLQDCIVASLHWSFETERYFGPQGSWVRDRGVVTLEPVLGQP